MIYFYLKKFLLIISNRRWWFILPVVLLLAKWFVIYAFFSSSEKVTVSLELVLPETAEIELTGIEPQKRLEALNLLLGLTRKMARKNPDFLTANLPLVPEDLLKRSLNITKGEVPMHKFYLVKEARKLLPQRIKLTTSLPLTVSILYQGRNKELGLALATNLSSHILPFLKKNVLKTNYELEQIIQAVNKNIDSLHQKLTKPNLTEAEQEYQKHRIKDFSIKLVELQSENLLIKHLFGKIGPGPTKITQISARDMAKIFSFNDLYLFIGLILIVALIAAFLEFAGQRLTTETQIARYLNAEIIGSIPRIKNPPQP